METPIKYKHGDILKASPGCLIVLEHGGKQAVGGAKALEELFLEYCEGNKNV